MKHSRLPILCCNNYYVYTPRHKYVSRNCLCQEKGDRVIIMSIRYSFGHFRFPLTSDIFPPLVLLSYKWKLANLFSQNRSIGSMQKTSSYLPHTDIVVRYYPRRYRTHQLSSRQVISRTDKID